MARWTRTVENETSVIFGGPNLDIAYITSMARVVKGAIAGGRPVQALEKYDAPSAPTIDPLTGQGCVSYVVTDLALLRWDGKRFVLDEVAPGFTPQEIVALTEMDVTIGPSVGTMQ